MTVGKQQQILCLVSGYLESFQRKLEKLLGVIMIHKLVSTFGLGILGLDPITAVYILSMGLRREKKTKITAFFLSFAGFSIVIGAALAAIFGATAVDLLKDIMPGNESPFWAVLNFVISVFILFWVLRKLFAAPKEKKEKENQSIHGSCLKYITTGFVFALTSFTDPTFYAVILMGGEAGSFFLATLLLTIWFLVSQFMAVIVYIFYEINLLEKLVDFIEKYKRRSGKVLTYLFTVFLYLLQLCFWWILGITCLWGNICCDCILECCHNSSCCSLRKPFNGCTLSLKVYCGKRTGSTAIRNRHRVCYR